MKNNARIQKINRQYVGEDCVQLMFLYNKKLCIKTGEKILFYDDDESNRYENCYVNDLRRHQFPYSTIPIHTEMMDGDKYTSINQILEFDTIYEVIRQEDSEPFIVYCKVVRDYDEAIVINALDLTREFSMNFEELKALSFTKTKEPKFRRWLNREIDQEEVKQQKNKMKVLKHNN